MKNILFLLLFLVISSCSKIYAPAYKSISDLEANRKGNNISLKGNVLFFNPNKTKVILKNAQIDVFLNDQFLSSINNNFDLQLIPEQDFVIPIEVTLDQDLVKSLIKNNTLQLLSGKKLRLHCEGFIKLKAYRVSLRVPVDEEIPININDLF